MLKWERLWPLVFVVAVFVGTALLPPLQSSLTFSQLPEQTTYGTPDERRAQYVQKDSWDILLTLATGIIAAFAVFQFFEFRRSSERQLRAYVFADARRVQNTDVGETPFLVVKIKNFGDTPAYGVKQHYRGGVQPYPLANPAPETWQEFRHTHPIAPGASIWARITLKRPLNDATIADIGKGCRALYFIGRVDYRDVFGRPHWTRYCLYSGGPLPLGEVGIYDGGNDTDDDAEALPPKVVAPENRAEQSDHEA